MILTNIQEQIVEDLIDRYQNFINGSEVADEEKHSTFHFEIQELANCVGVHSNELWNLLFDKMDIGLRYRTNKNSKLFMLGSIEYIKED